MAPSAIPQDGSNVDTTDTASAGRLLSRINLPPTPNPEPADSKATLKSAVNGEHSAEIREHLSWVIEHDNELQRCIDAHQTDSRKDVVTVTGDGLTIAELVAVAW